MCCWKPKKKTNWREYEETKKVKHNLSQTVDQAFVDEFHSEMIPCGGCNKVFTLRSNELKIHCASCMKFFHCQIAGPCCGPGCRPQSTFVNQHRERYCIHCVAKVYPNQECLCIPCSTLNRKRTSC